MSKNLGNGIDPIDVINEFGCDALRMSIVSNVTMGQDSKYSKQKAQNYAFFMNKLYNASKFVLMNKPDKIEQIEKLKLTTFDKWILKELNDTINYIDKKFDRMDISAYCNKILEFVWNKFCDNYIEIAKIQIANGSLSSQNVLLYVLKQILIILHPVVPFITEKIYQELPEKKLSIMQESFPKTMKIEKSILETTKAKIVLDIIKNVRAMRAENKISEHDKIELYVVSENKYVSDYKEIIMKLCNADYIEFNFANKDIKEYISLQTSTANLYLKTHNTISVEEQIKKLEEQLSKTTQDYNRCKNLLSNENFVVKAPASLVEKEKEKLSNYLLLIEKIKNNIKLLK